MSGANVGRPIVIKVGGDLAGNEDQLRALGGDLRTLLARGDRVVVVHGGGPQATALQRRMGLEPKMVGGRRVTDRETLEVVKMVLGGLVNVDLAAALSAMGLPALGISGVSAGLIRARRRPPRVVSGCGPEPVDFGFVGDIEAINADLLHKLLAWGLLPVLNSLGADASGDVYNINADIAATRVAQALAGVLVLTTGGVRGVLRDKDDPSSRIARLAPHEATQAIRDGVIVGGMIPKIEESLHVLAQGVERIHILGKLGAGDVLAELATPGAVGTALVPTEVG